MQAFRATLFSLQLERPLQPDADEKFEVMGEPCDER